MDEAANHAVFNAQLARGVRKGTPLIFVAAVLAFGALWLMSPAAHAQPTNPAPAEIQGRPLDPLQSDRCQSARREFESATTAMDSGRNVDRGPENQARLKIELERTRGVVASVCFDRAPGDVVPGRTSPPPAQGVPPPPPNIGTPPTPMPATPAPDPRASNPPPRPVALTTCDPGGCWDSNGTRLNGQGPVLTAPAGTCIAQGGFVTCR